MTTGPRDIPSLKIMFSPASGPGVGGGHVLRDLALAQALAARGAGCTFAVGAEGRGLIARFDPGAVQVVDLPDVERVGALLAVAAALRPDVLVLDDYGLSAPGNARLRGGAWRLAVIDDLADRAYAADLLIDPGYGRTAEDYTGRVPPGCRLHLGPSYALLRREIAEAARAPRRPAAREVARVFISFGLSDVGQIAARAVRSLRRLAPETHLDVALAADAASLPALRTMARRDARLHLHPDARDVATLMQAADLAVGAGGSSTWERCALGLPTLAVIVADNQRPVITALARDGLVIAADLTDPDFDRRLADAFQALADPALRDRLAAAGRVVCDGQGAARAAQAILALPGA